MNANDFQLYKIKKVMSEKGYVFFDDGAYNVNIIGVRNRNRVAGKFDDLLVLVYKTKDDGDFVIESFPITTDAGTYWMKNPMNKNGTALLAPKQYRGCFKIGLHKGTYQALVQAKAVSVYRDNDKDYIAEYDESKLETGMFGINIHRGNPYSPSVINGKWSAGCQVFQNPKDFNHFMGVCKNAWKRYGNTFTYTLLDQADIEDQYV